MQKYEFLDKINYPSDLRKLKKDTLKQFPHLKNYDTALVDDFIKSNLEQGNKIKHSELLAKIEEAGYSTSSKSYPSPAQSKVKNLISDGTITREDIIQD